MVFHCIETHCVGGILPKNLSDNMGIWQNMGTIYSHAMSMKKTLQLLLFVWMSGFFNWFIGYSKIFPNGWTLYSAIFSFIGVFILRKI